MLVPVGTMGAHKVATILVVDDEQPVVDLLTDILEDDGHTVISAYNGRIALEIVAQQFPDLVISDVMMPFVDGIQLCRRLREEHDARSLPIILMSAALPPDLSMCGANAFLGKPFDISRFDDLIALYVRGHGSAHGGTH
ncbi:MAG: response regulator [Chloroflexota bacterium]|nr:response regulator [Chloroflexota bacterium]MDQ6906037.1 response regulator [Chloroflexota bacterium]